MKETDIFKCSQCSASYNSEKELQELSLVKMLSGVNAFEMKGKPK